MIKPIMIDIVLTYEELATLLHALVRYYQLCDTGTPQLGMLLVSRLSSKMAEIVQDEAQAAIFRPPASQK